MKSYKVNITSDVKSNEGTNCVALDDDCFTGAAWADLVTELSVCSGGTIATGIVSPPEIGTCQLRGSFSATTAASVIVSSVTASAGSGGIIASGMTSPPEIGTCQKRRSVRSGASLVFPAPSFDSSEWSRPAVVLADRSASSAPSVSSSTDSSFSSRTLATVVLISISAEFYFLFKITSSSEDGAEKSASTSDASISSANVRGTRRNVSNSSRDNNIVIYVCQGKALT
ncbi:hypothetical protein Tcan_01740, partial [Toxocara canis]